MFQNNKTKICVGTNNDGYPEMKNFLLHPFKNYRFQKKYDLCKISGYLSYHFKSGLEILREGFVGKSYLEQFGSLVGNLHFHPFAGKCELWHFFNTISLNRMPWITTFETYVPRWGHMTKYGLEKGVQLLAGRFCKKLIAFSKCTYNYQSHFIEKNFPEYTEKILNKMTVIHPSQPVIVDNYNDKTLKDDHIELTMVGHQFFGKGGMEVLEVFQDLHRKGYPMKLNIVSSLETDNYSSFSSGDDVDNALEIINKYPDNISYSPSLPHRKVLDLFKHSHVGLLPTYADTYGYSVIESQACGTPVITTNVRALPEINSDRIGWVINVPKNHLGEGLYRTQDQRSNLSKLIKSGLKNILIEISGNRKIIKMKGKMCLKKVEQQHNPQDKASKIETIYNESIKL